ncbi:hypothetical protein EVAR_25611_1 [Eumeta japonica]|uniref:Uncharacterized protein n=1 Tax=Eumeta variegata TaxID=151549 RepID=A0A4C1V212_EUMVA|nr:hypothetical protein EVAR_25611_1 [Eumeta japonica]
MAPPSRLQATCCRFVGQQAAFSPRAEIYGFVVSATGLETGNGPAVGVKSGANWDKTAIRFDNGIATRVMIKIVVARDKDERIRFMFIRMEPQAEANIYS